ncbi:MAG TPA: ABC transporter permease subunit [Verrucomicrobiae bacterium]
MTVLPIVERELRVGARNPLFYRSRFMTPMVGAIIFLFIAYSLYKGAPAQMMGKTLLYICFGLIFAGCLFAGISLTADSISREKREGTLGFLFLTDLKGYDIVLGKLVSSSISGVYAAFGILPIVSVIFLMGGVEFWTVAKLVVSCVNALFLSLSAGLLASVLCVNERKSQGLASVLMVIMLLGGPLLGLLWFWATGALETAGQTNWGPFILLNPLATFATSVGSFSGGLPAFIISNAAVHGVGWVFLGVACWLAPKTWQEKGTTKRESKLKAVWRDIVYGKGAKMEGDRAAKLDINAIHWLTTRDRWAGWWVWGLWGLIVLGFVSVVALVGRDALDPSMAIVFTLVLNAAMKLSMAGEACRWIARDRQNGVLELVLTTSMSVDDILEGQWVSLRKLYLKPFIATVMVEFIFAVICLSTERLDLDEFFGAVYMMGVFVAMMFADYRAIGWAGMWKGLSTMPVEKSRQQTVSAVLALPWLFFYLALIPTACVLGGFAFFLLWPAAMLGTAGWWIQHSKRRLYEEFRTRAMERYSPVKKTPFFQMIGDTLDAIVTPGGKTKS